MCIYVDGRAFKIAIDGFDSKYNKQSSEVIFNFISFLTQYYKHEFVCETMKSCKIGGFFKGWLFYIIKYDNAFVPGKSFVAFALEVSEFIKHQTLLQENHSFCQRNQKLREVYVIWAWDRSQSATGNINLFY